MKVLNVNKLYEAWKEGGFNISFYLMRSTHEQSKLKEHISELVKKFDDKDRKRPKNRKVLTTFTYLKNIKEE